MADGRPKSGDTTDLRAATAGRPGWGGQQPWKGEEEEEMGGDVLEMEMKVILVMVKMKLEKEMVMVVGGDGEVW